MRARVGAAAAIVLVWVSSAVGAGAQDPSSYREIIALYRQGKVSEAVAALNRLPAESLEKLVDALIKKDRKDLMGSGEAFRVAGRARIQAAALLHTEIEMAIEAGTISSPFPMTPHGKLARTLVNALELKVTGRVWPAEIEGDRAFLRAWYRLKASYYQWRGAFAASLGEVRRGLEQLDDDPELLLAFGAAHETVSWMKESGRKIPGVDPSLKDAEFAYRAAIAAQPQLDEAAIRLCRVLALRGDTRGALAAVAGLGAPRLDPAMLYLARLFEGDAHERQRAWAAAEASYEAAQAAMPASQSARIALAHVRHAQGDRAAAVARITEFIERTTRIDDTADPWLVYQQGVGWRAGTYLAQARALVAEDRP